MEEDLISTIIALSSFGFFIILFIFVGVVIYLGWSRKLKIKYNPNTGKIDLFASKKQIGNIAKTDIKELRLSQYQVKSGNSSQTYYTYSMVLEETTIANLKSLYSDWKKLEQDSDKVGYRLESSRDEIFIRNKAENLSKELGVPLRNREGILRESDELDLPYHELMKDKADLDNFPPRYKAGDLFEIYLEGLALNFKSHDRNLLIYIPLGILLFITTLFFIVVEGYDLFFMDEKDPILFGFAILFNFPFFISIIFSIYVSCRIHFPKTIRIEKGLFTYGFMEIPVREIEEVEFDFFWLKIKTDRRVYTIFTPFLAQFQNMQNCVDLIKKSIIYQGMR